LAAKTPINISSMTYSLKKFSQLTDIEKEDFEKYCIDQSFSSDHASKNMSLDTEGSIITILNNTKRFAGESGEFFVLFFERKIAACSGIYISEFSKHVALAGVRTWTTKEFRNLTLHRNILLPTEKSWAISKGAKQIALSFNDYNKKLMMAPYRSRLGEGPILRSSKHLFHTNIHRVEFPVNIQNTKQWVLYEKIDPNWDFDWKRIEYVSCT
jgi:hypothetical protein